MIDEIDIFDTMSHKKKKHLHKLLLRKGDIQNTHTNTRRDTIPTIAYTGKDAVQEHIVSMYITVAIVQCGVV